MKDLRQIPIRTEKVYHSFYTDRLLEDVTVETTFHGTITIPAGFLTDFASSPRWTWLLVPKRGVYDLATLVHDYLYRMKLDTREKADAEQYHLMRRLDTPGWQRNIVWFGVRVGGQKRWEELGEMEVA